MKIKRYKKAERYMSLYKNNFGFREPYQILLDGTFCQVALMHKVNIQDQLPRYLNGQCKLLTTACVVEETKRLGKAVQGAHQIVSQFGVHDCGHEKPVSASRCLSSFIIESKNRDHYILATQDFQLGQKVSKQVVCPLVKLANNALVMEKPTQQVESKVKRTHHYLANKLKDDERSNLDKLKSGGILGEVTKAESVEKKRKRRGPKGPNPLSCKKSVKKTDKKSQPATTVNQEDASTTGKRRKRVKRSTTESAAKAQVVS